MAPTSLVPELGIVVPLRDVERELNRQIQLLHGARDHPVQRVRMSNLVVYCTQEAHVGPLVTMLADVTNVHPARVLLLVSDGKTSDGITAAVKAESRHLGNLGQACTELVILRAPIELAERLAFAVRALVIGDLPINLWWAANVPPPLAGQLLIGLGEHSQQIMYDSLGWPDPARGMAATASWIEATERTEAGRWRVVSDLNWRRLKYWRRFLAQAFEELRAKGATGTVSELQIEHGPHAVIQAWELAGWIVRLLGWKIEAGRIRDQKEMAWTVKARHSDVVVRIQRLQEGPPEVRRVRLVGTLAGQPAALNLFMEDALRLTLQLEGAPGEPRTMMLPGLTPAEIVGRQLSDRERDPVFRESMSIAQVMAQSLLM